MHGNVDGIYSRFKIIFWRIVWAAYTCSYSCCSDKNVKTFELKKPALVCYVTKCKPDAV